MHASDLADVLEEDGRCAQHQDGHLRKTRRDGVSAAARRKQGRRSRVWGGQRGGRYEGGEEEGQREGGREKAGDGGERPCGGHHRGPDGLPVPSPPAAMLFEWAFWWEICTPKTYRVRLRAGHVAHLAFALAGFSVLGHV